MIQVIQAVALVPALIGIFGTVVCLLGLGERNETWFNLGIRAMHTAIFGLMICLVALTGYIIWMAL